MVTWPCYLGNRVSTWGHRHMVKELLDLLIVKKQKESMEGPGIPTFSAGA